MNQYIENEISNLVIKVMEQKKLNEKADTTKLESQIDQFVYQLYDLNLEENKTIESV